MSKRPSFQFYPGDWSKDPALRRCTKAEKGVWIDMLCLMHECEDYGVLSTGGERWSEREIAEAISGDISENISCIAELLRKGVAHRNDGGAIFCKRMTRDEHKRKLCSVAGKRGGGNPLFKNEGICGFVDQKDETFKGHPKGQSKGSPKQDPNPSSSSSTTKQKKRDITKNVISQKEIELLLPDWLNQSDWGEFLEHREQIRSPMSRIAQRRAINDLSKLREAGSDISEVINQSIVNGWKGFFPLKNGGNNGNQRNFERSGGQSPRRKTRDEEAWDHLAQRAGLTRSEDIASAENDLSTEIPAGLLD